MGKATTARGSDKRSEREFFSMNRSKQIATSNVHGDSFSPNFFETQSKVGTLQKLIHWVTTFIQLIMTLFLIVGIALSFVQVPDYMKDILGNSTKGLLALVNYVSLVIIAVELIHVLNSQNLESVIEILMLAFVRELVIKEWTMVQLFMGVGCIAGLFAIKKWLLPKKVCAPALTVPGAPSAAGTSASNGANTANARNASSNVGD